MTPRTCYPPIVARLFAVVFAVVGFCPSAAGAGVTTDPFLAAASRPSDVGSIRLASAEVYATDRPSFTPVGSGLPVRASTFPAGPYDHGVAAGPPVDLASYGGYQTGSGAWRWEVLPDGLIYRSYLAGPREPRMALHTIHNESSRLRSENLWDVTLGGRKGVLRLGNGNPADPRGWQLDIEGAANIRLNLDEERDVDASDFRFGVPLTYTDDGRVRYKFGYYHVSSHLGDEFIARTGVNSRINYVRDAIIAGVNYQVTPSFSVYGETAWAFFTAGGAEPWEFQLGAEWVRPGPTGVYGTPFLATNAHLREETDFGGDWTIQTGWLWRGVTGTTFRLGLHYMNGKSTHYQFFNENEEQFGFGIWYDF